MFDYLSEGWGQLAADLAKVTFREREGLSFSVQYEITDCPEHAPKSSYFTIENGLLVAHGREALAKPDIVIRMPYRVGYAIDVERSISAQEALLRQMIELIGDIRKIQLFAMFASTPEVRAWQKALSAQTSGAEHVRRLKGGMRLQ